MSDLRSDALVHAALDGELDAAGAIAFEARLAADTELAAEYARLVALRDAIRARAPRPLAPDALRERMRAMAGVPEPRSVASMRAGLRGASALGALAASLVLGLILGAGGVRLLAPPLGADTVERALEASYMRARLANQPFDVASSDRHTVKPWFSSKIADATTVLDLKADGFALVGGRVDVVGTTPLATLIYQRREHQIALSELAWPDGASSSRSMTRDGFSLVEWTDRTRRFVAISDLPPAELEAFAIAFRRAAEAEREEPAKP